jgi:hypothetical protein
MSANTPGELPKDLVRARGRFQVWRRRRRKASSRIPEPLWKLAVGLVGTHGLSRTAIALGVDYYSLKKHVEEAAGPASGAEFVELPSPLVSKHCLFEFANGAGATMRVQLTGYDAADVEALSRGFWGVR